jgi:hypothetical protein
VEIGLFLLPCVPFKFSFCCVEPQAPPAPPVPPAPDVDLAVGPSVTVGATDMVGDVDTSGATVMDGTVCTGATVYVGAGGVLCMQPESANNEITRRSNTSFLYTNPPLQNIFVEDYSGRFYGFYPDIY